MASKNTKPSCNKVKNPCKFCLQQVTNKNGLQCQGACKKWAHYKCLNYTPGKISDIKAGIIKVTCPCPDCETTQPKEFLTNPPFTCSNHQCPANKTPKCDSFECPSNKNKGQTQGAQRPIPVVDFSPDRCPNSACSNEAIPCPGGVSPNDQPRKHNQQRRSHPRMSPPRPPTPPRSAPRGPQSGSPGCRAVPIGKQCFEEKNDPTKRSNPNVQMAECPEDCGGKNSGKKTKIKSPPQRSTPQRSPPQRSPPQRSPPHRSPSCSLLSSDTSACKFIKCNFD